MNLIKLLENKIVLSIMLIIVVVGIAVGMFYNSDITGTYKRNDGEIQKILKITDNENATLYNIIDGVRTVVPEKIIKENGKYYLESKDLDKLEFKIKDDKLIIEIINEDGKNEIVKYKKVSD
jgi:Trk K+ transport system NAD-binding subunit